jgi:opacity protein-like surface antigen
VSRGEGSSARRKGSWLALAAAVALMPPSAPAQEKAGRRAGGRGFLWGAAVGGGRLAFPGGQDNAVALGPVVGTLEVPGTGSSVGVRDARVITAGDSAPEAEFLVPLPAREGAGGFSMHAGYAFNPRVAVLLEVGITAGTSSPSYNHAVGTFAVRCWPASRLWVQAGPAFGDLGYGSGDTVVRSQSITGLGFQGGAGVSVLRKPRWSLDLEARYSNVGYDGFRASSLTLGVGASRFPR